MKISLLAISALAALAAQPLCAEEEKGKPIAADKLPAGAAATITKWAGNAKVSSIVVEKEGKLTVYEAVIEGPEGAKREVAVTAGGDIFSTEEVIALEKAPEAVRAAAGKAIGDGKLVTCEKIVTGEVTTYEITFTTGDKENEVELNADGSVKEDDEDEDDDENEDEDEEEDDKQEKDGEKK